jgi:protein TonB
MNFMNPSQWSARQAGSVFMMAGSVLVITTMLLINRFAEGPDQLNQDQSVAFVIERQAQTPPPRLTTPPPPPPRRSPPTPPAVALNTNLSGIDFGLPAFSGDELSALQDQLLGDTSDVVMTNDLVDSPPRPVQQVPMTYPSKARAQGLEGYVILSLLISASGEIECWRPLLLGYSRLRLWQAFETGVLNQLSTRAAASRCGLVSAFDSILADCAGC